MDGRGYSINLLVGGQNEEFCGKGDVITNTEKSLDFIRLNNFIQSVADRVVRENNKKTQSLNLHSVEFCSALGPNKGKSILAAHHSVTTPLVPLWAPLNYLEGENVICFLRFESLSKTSEGAIKGHVCVICGVDHVGGKVAVYNPELSYYHTNASPVIIREFSPAEIAANVGVIIHGQNGYKGEYRYAMYSVFNFKQKPKVPELRAKK
jgi:hypothetical protein